MELLMTEMKRGMNDMREKPTSHQNMHLLKKESIGKNALPIKGNSVVAGALLLI